MTRRHQGTAAGIGAMVALAAVAILWWRPWTVNCRTGSNPIRIMPLGDSLTEGSYVPGGYRVGLWSRLEADGLCVDFVGSQDGGPRSLPDRQHEGHPGWRIDQIAGSMAPWLLRERPDIVLLLIGTNDVVQGYALDAAPRRLGTLLDLIAATLPGCRVVVASIPPLAEPEYQQRARAYNAALADVVAARGQRVSYVDAFSALDVADLDADGIHLSAGGYDKLAAVWHPAVRALVAR
jgi:lysophospholipase L1-like esterase